MEGDVEPRRVVESQEDVMQTLITVRPCLLGPRSTPRPCPEKWGSQIGQDQISPAAWGSYSMGTVGPILRITLGW